MKPTAIALAFALVGLTVAAPAPSPAGPRAVTLRVLRHAVTKPLGELVKSNGALPVRVMPPVMPDVMPDATNPAPVAGFSGISAQTDSNTAPPPDTTGAAGLTQFVQSVNTQFVVFNKPNGTVVLGPADWTVLWTVFGAGSSCTRGNSSQTMTLYDTQSNHWIEAQLTKKAPYTYCVAVSVGPDATAGYYVYEIELNVPSGEKPSAPKLAVWSDGYYLSANVLTDGKITGALVAALDRAEFDSGAPNPTVVQIPLSGTSYSYMLPGQWEGPDNPPPPGDYYMRAASSTELQLFQFLANFANPTESTFTGPTKIKVHDPPSRPHPDVCTRKPGICDSISQPNTTTLLDAEPNSLMYGMAWRDLSGTAHLLANQTLVSSGDVASIEWYDIINPNTTPTVDQQGSISDPNDVISYWMGSIATDQFGDFAMGFNASSSSLFPSVYFAGRLPSDAAGTMGAPQAAATGTFSQTSSSAWGLYSSMTVDPVDDCTLWYTTEYIDTAPVGSTPNWNTWIAAFQFPACQ